MRLTCPHCGDRDVREFTYRGDALSLNRPDPEADLSAWDDYLHNRDNAAGDSRELWYHGPCGGWLVAERNTVTHEFLSTTTAKEAAR